MLWMYHYASPLYQRYWEQKMIAPVFEKGYPSHEAVNRKEKEMKVYLDMDGVIADFFAEAVRHSQDSGRGWRNMEFRDADRVLKRIRKTPDFFLTLPAFPMANTLVQSIVNITGSCRILSSPLAGYDKCEMEKRAWLAENIHYDFDEIIFSDNKPQYAQGNILIDDYGYNVRNWELNGGYGIKYQADENSIADVLVPLKALYMNTK
jgi:5'(3')-deoxyribonucleotidase